MYLMKHYIILALSLSSTKSKLDDNQLLSLSQMLGQNTPRTNAILLKNVLGQVQAGKQLTFE